MKIAKFAAFAGLAAAIASLSSAVVAESFIASPEVYSIHPSSFDRDYSRALEAIAQKDYGRAKRLLDRFSRGSWNPDVRYAAGVADVGTNNLRTASRHFSYAAAYAPDYLGAQVALAVTSVHLGDRKTAKEILRRLRARQLQCNAQCSLSAELGTASRAVERVIAR